MSPASVIGTLAQPPHDRAHVLPHGPVTFPDFVGGFMFEVFLYGVNIMLFGLAVFVLVHKSKTRMRWRLLASTVAMFILTTINTSISMYLLFGLLLSGVRPPESLAQTKQILCVYTNVIADTLLISRCYAAWNRSVRVILLPSIGLVAASIYGTFCIFRPGVLITERKYNYLWFALSLNILVTALTAGRIWWIVRRENRNLAPALTRKYYSAVAIIIESGAIYSLYILIDQIFQSFKSPPFFFHLGIGHVVVTAPLLLVVQIGLGRHIRDVETTIQHSHGASIVLSTVH